MMKLSSIFYGIARTTGRTASKLNDIETLFTKGPAGYIKRQTRKKIRKTANKAANKVNRMFH